MTKKSNGQTESQGRSYRPGSWFGIFGDHATVILPPTEKARVAALWELVDDGAVLDDVLDALVASGLRGLPGFVLLGRAEDATRVLLRGSATATFTLAGGETVEITSTKGGTWAERTLEKVESVQLALEDGAAGDDLVIGSGLVRVAQVDEPPLYADGGARVADEPVAEPVPVVVPVVEPELEAVPEQVPLEEPVASIGQELPAPLEQDSLEGAPLEDPLAEPAVDPVAEPALEPAVDLFAKPAAAPDAPYVPEAPYPAPPEPPGGAPLPPENPFASGGQPGQPEWQPEPAYAPEGGAPANPYPTGDPLSGQEWQPTDASQAPQAPYPPQDQQYAPAPDQGQAEEDDADHDGYTRAGAWDPGQFARPQPGIPGQPQAPSVTARPVANLIFSSGETIEVDRAILIGRAPEARRFTSTDQPRLVTVPSPNQEISSTHLEIRPGSGADHGAAIVTDMGSTNGTVLVQPGLQPEELQPGIAVALIPGAVVDLGDGVTIQVLNP